MKLRAAANLLTQHANWWAHLDSCSVKRLKKKMPCYQPPTFDHSFIRKKNQTNNDIKMLQVKIKIKHYKKLQYCLL